MASGSTHTWVEPLATLFRKVVFIPLIDVNHFRGHHLNRIHRHSMTIPFQSILPGLL